MYTIFVRDTHYRDMFIVKIDKAIDMLDTVQMGMELNGCFHITVEYTYGESTEVLLRFSVSENSDDWYPVTGGDF